VLSLLGVVVWTGWFLFALVLSLCVEMCKVGCGLPWEGVAVTFPMILSCYKLRVNTAPRRMLLSLLEPADSQPGVSGVRWAQRLPARSLPRCLRRAGCEGFKPRRHRRENRPSREQQGKQWVSSN